MIDLDTLLELIDDKIVKGANGDLLIRVDDLKALKTQFDEVKRVEKEAAEGAPKTLAGARKRLLEDKEWMAGFQKKTTVPVGDDVKPETEKANEAVTT